MHLLQCVCQVLIYQLLNILELEKTITPMSRQENLVDMSQVEGMGRL